MTHFKELLQSKDLKATHQRLTILEQIEIMKHVDIDRLYEEIIITNPTISKATLYRNLNDLVEKNIVSEVKIPEQKNQYEITKEPHIHLVCNQCNSVVDQHVDLSYLLNELQKNTAFNVQTSSVSFNGICEECSA